MTNAGLPVMSVEDLKRELDAGNAPFILDVREDWEYQLCHLEGSTSMPLGTVTEKYSSVPRDKPVVVMCHHGGRSARAVGFLQSQGYDNVANLTGGIHAWALRIDPSMKVYE